MSKTIKNLCSVLRYRCVRLLSAAFLFFLSIPITFSNNLIPIINDCPDDIVIYCSDGATFFFMNEWLTNSIAGLEQTTSNGCTDDITATTDFSVTDFFDYFDINCNEGGIEVTFTVVDECNVSATCKATYIVVDDVGPEINGVGDNELIYCGNTPSFSEPTINDDCSQLESSGFVDEISFACGGMQITRTWTATDICGNMSNATQVLTQVDVVKPDIFGVGASANFECGTSPVFSEPYVMDNCDAAPAFSHEDITVGDVSCAGGTITRIWTAIDACGNMTQANQTLSSLDTKGPVISGIITTGTYICGTEPEFSTLTATDQCDGNPTLSFQTIDGASSCGGNSKVRVWTAIDACGLETVVTQTMIAIDDEDPEILGVAADNTYECGTTPNFSEPMAIDNCDVDLDFYYDDETEQGECGLDVTRTWTAIDACNNYSQLSQKMTAVDNIPPPVPVAPADLELSCAADIPFAGSLSTVDECGGNLIVGVVEDEEFSNGCPNFKVVVRKWVFTDNCDNSSEATQLIFVSDTEAPQPVSVPDDIVLACDAELPDPVAVLATDNCDETFIVSMTSEEMVNSECTGTIEYVRTWSLIDECGNQTDVTQNITLLDETEPITFFPEMIEVNCAESIPHQTLIENYVYDDCIEDWFEYDVDFTTDFETCEIEGACCQIVVRNYTITDPCGNVGYGTARFKVRNDPPDIVCPAMKLVDDPLDDDQIDPAVTGSATATDPCSNDSELLITHSDGQIMNNCIARTWSVTEECGNVTTCTQQICRAVPLPLDLLGFSGVLESNSTASLYWSTKSEQGVDYFEVQHSPDGINFNAAGFASAKGNGANSQTTYSLNHNQMVRGNNYYRLKMVDINGQVIFSNIIILEVENKIDKVLFYPNPTSGNVMLQFPEFEGFSNEAAVDIYLYDDLQRLIKVFRYENISTELLTLDLGELKPGPYIMKIIHGSNAFSKTIIYQDRF